MSIEALKQSLPDYAKDIRLNISTVTTPEGAPGLAVRQVWHVALACAYATRNSTLIEHITAAAKEHLGDQDFHAARAAATIMAMNNVYYRFIHLVEDEDFKTMRANLRMTIIGNSGVDKVDFELMSLAVSAINGCGMCIVAHKNTLMKHEMTRESIQSAVRIAAVINAAAQALAIGE